ncbi:DUF4832 domain-containing protein [Flagellimonas iocasae]|uniref:DUF4832 domain-containing protein n=1 Tax=Flagellimonas iocasae TaxID=2055905 RepID=A0ABW4Y5R3_9FLAO
MKPKTILNLSLAILMLGVAQIEAQGIPLPPKTLVKVYPEESDELLLNPGIGFTTFQRFNGDDLNSGMLWTEGFPIEYQYFDGDLTNKDYPQTTIAYFRVNWRFLEVEPGVYNWEMIDKALKTAAERGQTLMLRISPYEHDDEKDVPVWYRKIVGEESKNKILSGKWRINPENPAYLKYFGGMIAAMGQRYDGHPDLEAVDVSFIGYWGEGDGMELLSKKVRVGLINKYLDNFRKTHLIFQPLNGDATQPELLARGTNIAAYWPDGTHNGEGPNMRQLGWRIDCLGDMGIWDDFTHMLDVYPQDIVRSGMKDAWKKAPIAMEICGTFLTWLERQKYNEEIVDYIFEQALKWHVSSFNAKSSPVPEQWSPLVDEWLKKMGYRFVLRRFTYPSQVKRQGQIPMTSWWENKGVAPIYKDYKFAVRLKSSKHTTVLFTDADIRKWLPGDIVYDEKLYVPLNTPTGEYQVEIAIVDHVTQSPRVKLAIEGVNSEGWYPMGKILVTD